MLSGSTRFNAPFCGLCSVSGTPTVLATLNTAPHMRWIIAFIVCILASSCGVAPQPEKMQTVAAFEVPLPTQAERERFLSVLHKIAESHSMHVDAATQEELERRARVDPEFRMTMNAAVWRGKSDNEPVASVMDQPDHLGQVWISFYRGEDPALNSSFREAAMREIIRTWPETLALPIMPTGAIPLHRDLIRTPKGYVVNPDKAHEYAIHGGGDGQR